MKNVITAAQCPGLGESTLTQKESTNKQRATVIDQLFRLDGSINLDDKPAAGNMSDGSQHQRERITHH